MSERSDRRPGGPVEPGGELRLAEGGTVLVLAGEIDGSALARFAGGSGVRLDSMTLAGQLPQVRVVDASVVTFADSAAVGLIAALIVMRERSGQRLVLRGVPDRLQLVLEVTGVLPLVEIED